MECQLYELQQALGLGMFECPQGVVTSISIAVLIPLCKPLRQFAEFA